MIKWENRLMASVWSKKDEENMVVICNDLKTKQSASDFVSSCSLERLPLPLGAWCKTHGTRNGTAKIVSALLTLRCCENAYLGKK